MTKLERRCHSTFAGRQVRGEYFDITFEEACAELDRHADESRLPFREPMQKQGRFMRKDDAPV